MEILLTGASGFTGLNLAGELVRRGHHVHALVRATSRVESLRRMGIALRGGDLGDPLSIERAVDGMEAIYHIAASYREARLPDSEYYKVNVLGTRHLLSAAKRQGVSRFVHCSTVGVHGHVKNPLANEEAPLNPGDYYQQTKLEGERVVREYMSSGLPAVIFRPVGIYGPGDRRFLKLFRAIERGTFIMFGSGNVLYHLTYIDDLVRGIIACGESDRALGKTYIIAGEKPVTLNELVRLIATTLGVRPPRVHLPFWLLWGASALCEALCRPLGVRPPLFRRRAEFFRSDRAFDTSKIEREIGFRPMIGLQEGLSRTANWYRAEALL